MLDLAWRNSLYGMVYDALSRSLEPCARNVVPGTEAVIARAFNHFRAEGDAGAAAILEAMGLAVSRLQLALRARREEEHARIRHELGRLAWALVLCSPMIPDPCFSESRSPAPLMLAA